MTKPSTTRSPDRSTALAAGRTEGSLPQWNRALVVAGFVGLLGVFASFSLVLV